MEKRASVVPGLGCWKVLWSEGCAGIVYGHAAIPQCKETAVLYLLLISLFGFDIIPPPPPLIFWSSLLYFF